MNKKPDIKRIAVVQSDEKYFADPAYGHSTLVKFERDGFKAIAHLNDPIDTPSIQFGKMVDCMMTEGLPAFHEKYHFQKVGYGKDTDGFRIANRLFTIFHDAEWDDIPIPDRLDARDCVDAWKNMKDDVKVADKIEKNCKVIFEDLRAGEGKSLCSWADYDDAKKCREAILSEPSCRFFFEGDDGIERHFQLQFFADFDGLRLKCKPDMLLVDHVNKRVLIGDLKTTSFPEWEFYQAFVKMGYMCQANMYSRIIRKCMDQDDDFKDYAIGSFFFVPICRETLTPILFHTDMNFEEGDFSLGRMRFRDPVSVAKELDGYIKGDAKVPSYIVEHRRNSLDELIKKM